MTCRLFFSIAMIPLILGGEIIESKYPADMSFLITDFKYSNEKGIKVCEVQHGILSTYFGDSFLNGFPGVVAPSYLKELSKYQNRIWTIQCRPRSEELRTLIPNSLGWSEELSFRELIYSPEFQKRASEPLLDPYDLTSYNGALFLWKEDYKNLQRFRENYPGILVLDAATYPFWKDKNKMTQLFTKSERLASFKPKWGLYSKAYTPELADKIISEIGGDIFVIKPRGAFLGDGVIIVHKDDLETTLSYILHPTSHLKNNPDHSYNYWVKDPFDSLIVEEFIESDPIVVPHLGNQVFQPTMRAIVVLTYHKQQMNIKVLEVYWQIPHHPLSDQATLNGRYESHGHPPYFCKVDPVIIPEVKKQLKELFTLLYAEMLKR